MAAEPETNELRCCPAGATRTDKSGETRTFAVRPHLRRFSSRRVAIFAGILVKSTEPREWLVGSVGAGASIRTGGIQTVSRFFRAPRVGDASEPIKSNRAVLRVVAIAVAGTLALTACSGGSKKDAGSAPSSTASASASSSSAPTTPATTTSAPSSAPANSSKPGVSTAPTTKVTAPPAPFTKPVTYPDGIDLQILGATQETITDTGPGALTGKPKTTFLIKFTNNTHAAIALNAVVVSVSYGANKATAAPVYDTSVADFGGTVAPGKSVQTHYAFSIPASDLSNVTMTVRFDGLHAAATFTGEVVVK
jgi:hypothetical protein